MKVHRPCLDNCLSDLGKLFSEDFAECYYGKLYDSFIVQSLPEPFYAIIEKEESVNMVMGYYNAFLNSLEKLTDEINLNAFKTDEHITKEYFEALRNAKEFTSAYYQNTESQLVSWNNKRLEEFKTRIEREELEYFQDEKRTQYQHLEKYDNYVFGIGNLEETNYDYYCIKHSPALFNLDKIDHYQDFLYQVTYRFCTLADRYITLFNEGIFEKSAETQKAIPSNDKIKVNLSVEGLALLFRSLEEAKCIEIEVGEKVSFYRAISLLFLTKGKKNKEAISTNSFKIDYNRKTYPLVTISEVSNFLKNARLKASDEDKKSER